MAERAGGSKTTVTATTKKSAAAQATTAPVAGRKTSRRAAAGQEQPPAQAPPTAAQTAAEGATMVKPAESKTASRTAAKPQAGKPPVKKGSRTSAETEKIRLALTARRDELQEEYDHTLTEIADLQRDRLTDSAGDDQADTGTKTFEREQELTLANTMLERVTQVERALERLDEGSYGWCERCGNPIPVERLAAFPSATLCVSCKQLEERR
jgi:RNA polymerase-binding protein DksA